MRITAKLATGVLLTAAAFVPLGGAAQAAPATPGPGPLGPTALTLTVAQGDSAATTVPERAVTLTCAPQPGGTHPDAAAACRQLRAAEGDFGSLNDPDGTFCPMHYDPVVVTAQGVWDGRRVSHEHTYGNACVKNAEGGAVFAF
ncbi:subtilase-type protease inhibitor [Streptomyces sp. TRM 70351]|uniref:subtilase-type protease inhibitor n=1 Tax=Streptomyces sp. TRM 70351 TaxID=3116552 RepID=UPI002E7B3CDB|nr:subtilase-type protease inhibitor [Streptomyces sp. TRM 70351]MEE1929797.1 subtilase-type protease inhibitor [Streptomyces sp. TRM 70351]